MLRESNINLALASIHAYFILDDSLVVETLQESNEMNRDTKGPCCLLHPWNGDICVDIAKQMEQMTANIK